MAVAFLPQVACATYEIEINETNFPDKNFRNYLLQQDYGKDGKLTKKEMNSITGLYVESQGIRSLQGIEFFLKLTDLRCDNNQLITLNTSKNKELSNLSCSGNPLTSLDFPEPLESLNYRGLLKSLNVSRCTALTELWCGGNQLTSLDVSGCTALTMLDCTINQLTALDVSGCTALTLLYCVNNQLTALDVSGCTALTILDCRENQIKGGSMDGLINSLPTKRARLYVYSSSSNEGNVCTKKQVQVAKGKGWDILYYDDDSHEFHYYEGSDDTPSNIDNIRTEDDKDAPVYNLRGERLTAPQKGINIIGGRKVVVE